MAKNTNTTVAGVSLTVNELAAMTNLLSSEYVDGAPVEVFSVWDFAFNDMVAAATGLNVRAAKGVTSSLVKKGLVTTHQDDPHGVVSITKLGVKVYTELHPEAKAAKAKKTPAVKKERKVRAYAQLTRKQCVARLRELGYDGPTSYLMPRVREIVAEVEAAVTKGSKNVTA